MSRKIENHYFGSDVSNNTEYGIVQTPSGKDANYENFPVGSWLLPRKLRSHIAIFYLFARTIDDIADNPCLSAEEKIINLEGFEVALLGHDLTNPVYKTAHKMRDSLNKTGVTSSHCIDLIAAFKLDAKKLRYRNWDELMEYCILSAAPVGRYLIDLHGGSSNEYAPSDALCKALQVINHLQDCKDDFQSLNRVYLPGDWLADANVKVEELSQEISSDGLRKVIDSCLKETSVLMGEAIELPRKLKNRRLAMESAAIIEIAQQLICRLGSADPLGVKRINLTKSEYFFSCTKGVVKSWFF
jgi:squalene synthase HpnC